MQTQNHSMQFLKKRKFLTVLPLLVIPFLTLAFWALGGGKGNNETITALNKRQGINLQLPNAKLKEDPAQNKLSFYNKAEKDSLAFKDEVKNDPYYKKYMTMSEDEEGISQYAFSEPKMDDALNEPKARFKNQPGLNTSPKHSNLYTYPNERNVRDKLEELNKAIKTQTTP
ncbi:MAG: hypothetical protein ABI861_12065, partial [Panacibacter sp.]